jgi:tRNA threonylcarbamoyladenosine biosynthesis protein TsaE
MAEICLNLSDEAATLDLGARLGSVLAAGDVVCLSGPLGAGKTTFARGAIAALTGAKEAPSPTFALVETYEGAGIALWHFDLYRLERAEDVWELGLEEALAGGASLIEWPERIVGHLPETALSARFEHAGSSRRVIISAGENWMRRLRRIGLIGNPESGNKR